MNHLEQSKAQLIASSPKSAASSAERPAGEPGSMLVEQQDAADDQDEAGDLRPAERLVP